MSPYGHTVGLFSIGSHGFPNQTKVKCYAIWQKMEIFCETSHFRRKFKNSSTVFAFNFVKSALYYT